VQRIGGQVRRDYGDVLGWDFAGVYAQAKGMGIPDVVVAEFLPFIEVQMVNGRAAAKGGSFEFPDGEAQ
jgi:hypothetical protein